MLLSRSYPGESRVAESESPPSKKILFTYTKNNQNVYKQIFDKFCKVFSCPKSKARIYFGHLSSSIKIQTN